MMVEPSEVTDMDLYLMQHGQATTETEDSERPLTDAGRAAVQRVAERARAADVRISGCLHSGKLRAEQTAQLLVREIGVEPSVEARPGLAPNDPVVPVAQWLRARRVRRGMGASARPRLTCTKNSSAPCITENGAAMMATSPTSSAVSAAATCGALDVRLECVLVALVGRRLARARG